MPDACHWCSEGRLDDKSALVRKAALQLIGAMTAANPFGPFLNLNAFKGSLEEQRQKLQVRSSFNREQSMRSCHLPVPRHVGTIMVQKQPATGPTTLRQACKQSRSA